MKEDGNIKIPYGSIPNFMRIFFGGKIMYRKLCSALVLCALLLTSVCSCSSGGTSDGGSGSDGGDSSANTTAANTRSAQADLPETDFEGANFTFYVGQADEYQVYAESLNGEMLNDAVYERNRTVNEKYNVKIVTRLIENSDRYQANGELVNTFVSDVLAGDSTFDVAATFAYQCNSLISNGVCYDWKSLPYMDFEQPWWNALATKADTINGKMYTAVGDLSLTALLYTNCYFVNTNLAENYNITTDSLYQNVFDGKWTIDYFTSLISNIYSDLDGNSTKSVGDLYGYASSLVDSVDAWPIAFKNPITSVDSSGSLYSSYMTERIQSGIEKLVTLLYSQAGTYIPEDNGGEVSMFVGDKVVFIPGFFNIAFNQLRSMSSDYMILPYPKYDEAQDNYYTTAMDEYSVFVAPKNLTDTEKVAIVMEALTVESYNTVTPAYYDSALKGKYASSADMAKMVDLIMENRCFDIAFMFGSTLQNLPYMLRPLLKEGSTSIASSYEQISSAVDEGLKTIASYYA